MLTILRVGDPHVKPNNIEESHRLIEFVVKTAIDHKVDRIELMGDLFHTHNVMHLSVIEFWDNAIMILSKICHLVILVGNHDQSGDYTKSYNALTIFSKRFAQANVDIIQTPQIRDNYVYMPYMHNKEEFVMSANSLADQGGTVLVAHQTFTGSKYENGMYAPDGLDPDLLSAKFIHLISGHIHTEQDFGRVIYPGTARWDTVSDANRRKGIWVYDHDDDGTILSAQFISTHDVCSPIISIEWREGEVEPTFQENSRTSVELIGSSIWVNAQKLKLKGKVAVRTKLTDKVNAARKSPGTNIESFILNYFQPSPGISKERVIEYMKESKLV